MPHEIRMGIRIRAPRDRVFEHLLMPHHLARWWCSFAQVSPKPGGAFNFGGDYCIVPPEGPAHKCVFTGGEVRKSVTFTWPLFGGDTNARWEVEDAGDFSNFRVVHTPLAQVEGPCGGVRDAYRVCLGNLKAISENRGDSLRPEYAAIEKPEIRLAILIETPPAKVFEALPAANRLQGWATRGDPPRMELRPAGQSPQHPVALTVLDQELGKSLALSWSNTGTVTWELESKASGTGVYLSHECSPIDPQTLVNLRAWWSSLLVDLKNYLETGEAGFLEPYEEQQVEA